VMNIALLKYPGDILGFPKGQTFYGVTHFGMWVDDLDESAKRAEAAGATHASGSGTDKPGVFYEVKYKDPNGVVFDLTHSGWKGAVKDVVPAGKAAAE
jgi:lactoylglutathione lyase